VALARAIAQTSRDELGKWGAAGRVKYAQQYDIRRVNSQLFDLYQFLIKAKRATR
jgi:hypothetical protein